MSNLDDDSKRERLAKRATARAQKEKDAQAHAAYKLHVLQHKVRHMNAYALYYRDEILRRTERSAIIERHKSERDDQRADHIARAKFETARALRLRERAERVWRKLQDLDFPIENHAPESTN